MLDVTCLSVSYGQHRALDDVSIHVGRSEITVILGANGAGKSTLLRAIAGNCEGSVTGEVEMNGQSINGLPTHQIVEAGIALVPEGRGVFGELSVRENLLLGAYTSRARTDQQANLAQVLDLFPKLRERQNQTVRTMSGGEQQMVAIGRAMMSAPSILMLDETSLGLSPLLCRELFQSLTEVRKGGLGILLVEQNAKQSLAIADRGYLLENAQIKGEDSAENLASDPNVQRAYLGVSGDAAPEVVHAPAASSSVSSREAAKDGPEDSDAKTPVAPAIPRGRIGRHAAPQQDSADDLIGESIEEMVRSASAQQSDATGKAPVRRPSPKATDDGHESVDAPPQRDRLQEVLSEIEQAAASARLDTHDTGVRDGVGNDAAKSQASDADRATEIDDDLPSIEVWKRKPMLEVYRREPTHDGKGKLKKIKGDGDE